MSYLDVPSHPATRTLRANIHESIFSTCLRTEVEVPGFTILDATTAGGTLIRNATVDLARDECRLSHRGWDILLQERRCFAFCLEAA